MRKKIECLDRLFVLLKCRTDILQFLKDEKLINDDTMNAILIEHHATHSTKIATILEDLVKADRLQLVDYEWTILPKELVKLTIVTPVTKKEFGYRL